LDKFTLTHGAYGGIFITGIFGNFYTEWGEFLTPRRGIPGGRFGQRWPVCLWEHYVPDPPLIQEEHDRPIPQTILSVTSFSVNYNKAHKS